MANLYDIAYWSAIGAGAPFWLSRTAARQKVFKALRERMGQTPARTGAAPAVLIHAVSLGEVNATRALAGRLHQLRPDLQIIISTTTETGFARANELYGSRSGAPDHPYLVIRYPLDFSSAIGRALDALRPSAAVLMELEIWPNFILQCARREIPVLLVNGRMTELAFRRYRLIRPVVAKMFRRMRRICVQDEDYARRFMALGAPADRVAVTGTMKFDTATVASRVDGDETLAGDLGFSPRALKRPSLPPGAFDPQSASVGPVMAERVWVCGSTGPGEEQLVLDAYRELLKTHARLRLAIVPRKPERFDEVAELIEREGFNLIRRSQRGSSPTEDRSALPAVILGDTMGELRKFYSLADVVFVGRTLVDLGPRQHGSDMIEPAALGKATIVGPYTGNFADAMSRFRAADAMLQVETAAELMQAVSVLLSSPDRAREMGQRAQQVVVAEKGATERHVEAIAAVLEH